MHRAHVRRWLPWLLLLRCVSVGGDVRMDLVTWKGETHHTVDLVNATDYTPPSNHPAVLRSGLIMSPRGTSARLPAQHHASTLVEMWPGRLMAAWFGGTAEGAADVGIWSAFFTQQLGWSHIHQLVAPHGIPRWNPVLTKLNDELLLFYKVGRSVQTWRGMLMRSNDNGTTWEAPELLPNGVLGPTKNNPLLLRDGTLLCPSSVEGRRVGQPGARLEELWTAAVDATRDGGRTWSHHGPIAMDGVAVIQPALYVDERQNVRMLLRTGPRVKYMAAAASDHSGVQWSTPVLTSVPNPNSALDALRLADGRLLLVYNHSFKPRKAGRSVLVVALSMDDGANWSRVLTLEDAGGRILEFSHPAVIQASNGDIHITYTWMRLNIRHVVLDPTQLVTG